MEHVTNPLEILSPREISELTDAWRGKWLAIVDDWTQEEDTLKELFGTVLGLEVVETSREMQNNPNSIVMQQFDDAESFISTQRATHSFDVCIMDGRLGDSSSLTGDRAVRKLRVLSPDLKIIGRSAEDGFNNKFAEMNLPVFPKKQDIVTAFPGIVKSIVEEEEDY